MDALSAAALPERCWILTHNEWIDNATRQTFEVITNPEVAAAYRRGDPAGYQIAEFVMVCPSDTGVNHG